MEFRPALVHAFGRMPFTSANFSKLNIYPNWKLTFERQFFQAFINLINRQIQICYATKRRITNIKFKKKSTYGMTSQEEVSSSSLVVNLSGKRTLLSQRLKTTTLRSLYCHPVRLSSSQEHLKSKQTSRKNVGLILNQGWSNEKKIININFHLIVCFFVFKPGATNDTRWRSCQNA